MGKDAHQIVGEFEDRRDGEPDERVVDDEEDDDEGIAAEEAALLDDRMAVFEDQGEAVEEDAPAVEQRVLQVDAVQVAVLLEQQL